MKKEEEEKAFKLYVRGEGEGENLSENIIKLKRKKKKRKGERKKKKVENSFPPTVTVSNAIMPVNIVSLHQKSLSRSTLLKLLLFTVVVKISMFLNCNCSRSVFSLLLYCCLYLSLCRM